MPPPRRPETSETRSRFTLCRSATSLSFYVYGQPSRTRIFFTYTVCQCQSLVWKIGTNCLRKSFKWRASWWTSIHYARKVGNPVPNWTNPSLSGPTQLVSSAIRAFRTVLNTYLKYGLLALGSSCYQFNNDICGKVVKKWHSALFAILTVSTSSKVDSQRPHTPRRRLSNYCPRQGCG